MTRANCGISTMKRKQDVSNPIVREKVEASLTHVYKMLADCEAKMLASASGRYTDVKSLKDSHKNLTKERLRLEKMLAAKALPLQATVVEFRKRANDA